MCRLLGYVARQPHSVEDVVGDALPAFVSLSQFHADGWGFAWYAPDGKVQVAKAPEAAESSAAFAESAARVRADMLIAHLRWATPGMPLCAENTHPFTDGSLAFAHNGSVMPVDAVEALIDPALRPNLSGTTDSERYFAALLTVLERIPDPADALRSLLGALHERTRSTSLNALLLTPDALYVVCDWRSDAPMVRKDPDYYQLSYNASDDAVVIGSSGWQRGPGWQTIPNGQILVVERATLRTRLVPLPPREQTVPEEVGQAQPIP